jgi:O-antigen/teichoic acid export membrane protein
MIDKYRLEKCQAVTTERTDPEIQILIVGSESKNAGAVMGRLRSIFKVFLHGSSGVGAVSQTAVTNAIIQATNIACGLISARVLGPQGRGDMAAITLWPQFMAYLLTLGIPVASLYHIKRNPALADRLTGVAMLTGLITGCIGSAIGLLIIPYSLKNYTPEVIHWAKIIVLTSPLALLGLTLNIHTQSAGSFKTYNLFRVMPPLLILCGLACESFLGSLNPVTGALIYTAAGVPVLIWNFIWVIRHFRPRLPSTIEPVKALFSYGLRIWGSDLLGTVASQVDRVLVIGFLSPTAVGLYVVAQSAAALLNIIPASLLAVILPKASDKNIPEIIEIVGRATRVSCSLMVVIGLPLCIFSNLALKLVYGGKFDGASVVLKILIAEGILDGAATVLTQAFLAAGCPGMVTLLQMCGLATALPLLAFMGPRWGLNGAASAMLVSTSIRLLLVMCSFKLRLKVRAPNIRLTQEDIMFLLSQLGLIGRPRIEQK